MDSQNYSVPNTQFVLLKDIKKYIPNKEKAKRFFLKQSKT